MPSTPRRAADRTRYLSRVGIGLMVVVAASLLVRDGQAEAWEPPVFHVINGLPDLLHRPLWLAMQFGNLAVVPLIAVVLLGFRKWKPALSVLLVGAGKYLLERAVKAVIVRHRPARVIEDVILRNAPAVGRGFLSGHVVVAVGLATVLSPWFGRPTRIALWTLAGIVCFGRMYVGAHLPLDVIGGGALGYALGSLVTSVVTPPAAPGRDAS